MRQQTAVPKISAVTPPVSGTIQAKLRIGKADDAYEREADQVADRVMRMPEPNVQHSVQRSAQGIQRMCAGCKDEEETLQRKEDEEEDETLQRKEAGSSNGPASAPRIVRDVLSGSGSPLDASVRSYMEPRFGHDFSKVRVHSGSRAAESASAVNALAYTVGNNVVFNRGAYRPESASGKRLIAHELTHVVQQGGGKHGLAAGADIAVQRTQRCWPFNGTIRTNNFPNPIEICDEGVVSTKPARWTSNPGGLFECGDDIDHVHDPVGTGLWCKIGANNVDIDSSGSISGCKCWTSTQCGHC